MEEAIVKTYLRLPRTLHLSTQPLCTTMALADLFPQLQERG